MYYRKLSFLLLSHQSQGAVAVLPGPSFQPLTELAASGRTGQKAGLLQILEHSLSNAVLPKF